ncbi:2-dehydropantoate 2-reductase [compost metagenome]
MKICIVGLGAIGGLFAARLARAGFDVSAVARGATLDAVQRDGLTFVDGSSPTPESIRLPIKASKDAIALGEQDVIIVAVKTTGLASVALSIAPLLGPDTAVLSAMNGVPWWFFEGLSDSLAHIRIPSVDPEGGVSQSIPAARVVGCVTHLSAMTPAPGVVRSVAGNRLIVGEPSGGATPRSQSIAGALRDAGFDVEETGAIQQEIWFKLWGNMTVNPVSALTGATGDRILDDDYVRHFMSRCMVEAAEIGRRIGLPIEQDPEQRHVVTRKLGAFKTSMLQDVEASRPVELDALVHAVLEISRQVGVPTPNIDALFGLARLQARTRGLY